MIIFSLMPNRKWKSKTGDANQAEKGYPVSMRNDVCLIPHYLSSLQTKPGSREGLSDFFESGAYRLKANEKRRSQSPDAMARMRSQEVIFSFNPVLQVVFCTAWMREIIHLFLGHLAASCLMCLQAKQQGWWARTQTISKGKNLESIPDSPLPFSFPSVLCAFSLLPFFNRIWTLLVNKIICLQNLLWTFLLSSISSTIGPEWSGASGFLQTRLFSIAVAFLHHLSGHISLYFANHNGPLLIHSDSEW